MSPVASWSLVLMLGAFLGGLGVALACAAGRKR
jgi:hypothetical protein